MATWYLTDKLLTIRPDNCSQYNTLGAIRKSMSVLDLKLGHTTIKICWSRTDTFIESFRKAPEKERTYVDHGFAQLPAS